MSAASWSASGRAALVWLLALSHEPLRVERHLLLEHLHIWLHHAHRVLSVGVWCILARLLELRGHHLLVHGELLLLHHHCLPHHLHLLVRGHLRSIAHWRHLHLRLTSHHWHTHVWHHLWLSLCFLLLNGSFFSRCFNHLFGLFDGLFFDKFSNVRRELLRLFFNLIFRRFLILLLWLPFKILLFLRGTLWLVAFILLLTSFTFRLRVITCRLSISSCLSRRFTLSSFFLLPWRAFFNFCFHLFNNFIFLCFGLAFRNFFCLIISFH